MISVSTGSRIHFGLIPVLSGDPPQFEKRSLPRRYAGIGLMVEKPSFVLRATPAKKWSAEGPMSERVLDYAQQLARIFLHEDVQPFHFVLEQAPLPHCGFGTGTQIALAVARALVELNNLVGYSLFGLARLLGRGTRTTIGIAGFEQGGLVLDLGRPTTIPDHPNVRRLEFRADWRLVLFTPPTGRGLHGEPERIAFEQLGFEDFLVSNHPMKCLDLIWRGANNHDFRRFSQALYDFNLEVGKLFAPAQGGIYGNLLTAEIIEFVRKQGIEGVGQSSWGPAGFAIVEDEQAGQALATRLRNEFNLEESAVIVTRAYNCGAKVSVS